MNISIKNKITVSKNDITCGRNKKKKKKKRYVLHNRKPTSPQICCEKEQSVDKFHIRHLMLYEFRKHNNAANAISAINAVYPGALGTRTRQC
ncbi:hypothetical protein E2986_13067 [Frieseomelitta varia]|uniref:Mos1 transposase HTH domain-containing protein n=1 Tax=Frieseomelitta varia TaxID=561572 RepID=A0A833RR48_9HYME|nr:hypothetical protein E2986_13067 [Frieseomelitta varia]